MDELARWGMGLILLAAGATFVVGGLAVSVAGGWRDGGRRVVLQQVLGYVRGRGEVAGGLQIYRGVSCFGRLWLWRHDYGARHLQALGFATEQVRHLEGQVTGMFRLQLKIDAAARRLEGSFRGKRFVFHGTQLKQAGYVAADPRAWTWDDA